MLRGALWEWTDLVERETRTRPAIDDTVWLYNERASLSVLAGAVWRTGGTAFEEYEHEKRHGARGRCDVHLALDARAFVCEAKQCWASAGATAHPGARVASALSSARKLVTCGMCRAIS